eukprot:Partr_v1_DN26545_c2_g1_i2_m3821 putative Catalyzes the dehydration of the S-form of NAD(P)HX at the expense of ATP, which is converted to ADP. Together with NAD(P)HX epimerase, which catalyzes the epimerization of the S- and R-forms, the enzyme allows the repair of both epimers of NAD(P)HX, a damaged form of NAD(P)H that is a result of enzymatic or heat-dependent hydration (By similarity)
MMNHLDLFKHLIPPLNSTLHKGQAGRIGIIGGSLEYTGAPFFAASTALRLGSDLVYIFCEREAGVPLKCLSPDFIVHPCIQSDTDRLTAVEYKDALRTTLQTITDSIGKLHAVLIGPGAGRAPMMLDVIRGIIPEVRKADIPLVIDADGLFALMDGHHGLIAGYQKAIITPNIMELGRLVQHVGLNNKSLQGKDAALALSKRLDKVIVLAKGNRDHITNVTSEAQIDDAGSLRRCGGQGDVLAGAVTAYSAWAYQALNGVYGARPSAFIDTEYYMASVVMACKTVRCAGGRAFRQHARSMTTSEVIKEIPAAFQSFGLK